jgi:inner membrane protein involved in colicin E2 resistance
MNKIILQKGFAISALACVILIALYMVSCVIDDRQKYRDAAVQSIEGSYAGPQILIGPILVRPYTQSTYKSCCSSDLWVLQPNPNPPKEIPERIATT